MDGVYALGNAKATIEKSASQNDSDHKDGDTCSPFCSCNCCAGLAFLVSAIKVSPVIHVPAKMYSGYLSSAAIEISLPIWQPPQLS